MGDYNKEIPRLVPSNENNKLNNKKQKDRI